MKSKPLKELNLHTCVGDTIQEHIDFINMSNEELAKKLDITINELDKIIKCKTKITKELSIKLEQVLDVSANFWIKLSNLD